MSNAAILVLGAFAGLTIFLGFPLAFFSRAPQGLRVFLNMLATGVLVFLLYDVVAKASEPIGAALDVYSKGGNPTAFLTAVGLFIGGFAVGLLGLVYFNKLVFGRVRSRARITVSADVASPATLTSTESVSEGALASAESGAVAALPATAVPARTVAGGELSPRALALIIATGIGLHNFSEGLAIGQSAATGALALATVLIIGFGLHNMTEGFGIAGPLAGQRVSLPFIILLGLIGGGPTFLGTVVGIQIQSTELFILFLALAAGAILFVVAELLGVAKRFGRQDVVMWGLFVGFFLGYITDLVVSFAGA
jgi:zinc transporter, ZIP family